MKQRTYRHNFIFRFRYGIIFLVTLFTVSFGGKVSAANLPQIEWLRSIDYGIKQQVSLESIQMPLMFAKQKSIYNQDLEVDLRQDGVVVWRKITPMDLTWSL